MAGAEHATDSSEEPGEEQSGPTEPSPPSWLRSLAPLAIIFAFSLAMVLVIVAFT